VPKRVVASQGWNISGMTLRWTPTMTCKRGDIVLVAFPNRDGLTVKRRPALVVQSNSLSDRLSTVVVAAISSRTDLKGLTRILVSRASPEGRAGGPIQDSLIFIDELRSVTT
jgi:mRNA interferase MazF